MSDADKKLEEKSKAVESLADADKNVDPTLSKSEEKRLAEQKKSREEQSKRDKAKNAAKKPAEPAKKVEPKKSAPKPKAKKEVKMIPCEACKGTGLDLPEGDIKFKSQATASCKECEGSGSVEE